MTELPIIDSPHLHMVASAWQDPAHWHAFDSAERQFVYLTDGSQIYEWDGDVALLAKDPQEFAETLGIPYRPHIDDEPLTSPQTRSLSLAISQTCNLACTYCYAQEGSFGGSAKAMSREVAYRAVDYLLSQAVEGDRVHLSFLGGEPMVARKMLRETVEYAESQGRLLGVRVGFSITTNGTLLTPSDAEFLAQHRFAVTVSLDGVGETHDLLRLYKSSEGTFETILRNILPLLRQQAEMQVSARVTVTPRNLCLPETLTELIALGFHSVGFSPMLSSPSGHDEMDSASLHRMLEQMIACGRLFEEQVQCGNRFPFSNMANAMMELHRGTHRPYPCGAGAGYLGVSADGELAACHRFVNDDKGAMGDLRHGIDRTKQNRWLSERHVHRQEPCQSCWARYLCGGGCHHEVLKRGRPACNYIRGWLHYCLEAYVRLQECSPLYFQGTR